MLKIVPFPVKSVLIVPFLRVECVNKGGTRELMAPNKYGTLSVKWYSLNRVNQGLSFGGLEI